MSTQTEYDVAIVGYGPIGKVAAIMLARRGYRVAVVERWPAIYPLPRAVVYDDEIARLFQQEGILDEVLTITDPVPDFYEWRNRDGDALLKIDWSVVGPTGRQVANFFSQPELQTVLDREVRAHDLVDLHFAWQLEDLRQDEDEVVLSIRRGDASTPGQWKSSDEVRDLSARYVIGADGANSKVRELMGVENVDLGFNFDWLIVDVRPHEDRQWSPMNWQLCDPQRPTTIVSGGPGRRRWEFMRLPGETIAELNTLEAAWRLLEPWDRTPANTTIERHAVYTFQARWAEEWRRGRLLLAGDAAHLMPPFAGQGMCGGMRDVANLVWKLDLVLRDKAPDALLDSYGSERSAHAQSYIHLSMALGQVICVLDEDEAAARDERMIAGEADPGRVLPQGPPPQLGPGVLTAHPLAGMSMPQGRVTLDGQTGLLDELVAPRFLVLARSQATVDGLSGDARAALEELDAQPVVLDESADVDGVYAAVFDEHDAVALLVRPDSYVYGVAASPEELAQLIGTLREQVMAAGSPEPSTP